MTNFSVSRFIPCDPSQVVLGLKILEANVPNEGAERLDGIDLVALCANETKTQALVGILGKAFLLIRRIVIAGVLERVEAYIPQRCRAARERFEIDSQWRGPFSARIDAGHAADRREQPLQMPTPNR